MAVQNLNAPWLSESLRKTAKYWLYYSAVKSILSIWLKSMVIKESRGGEVICGRDKYIGHNCYRVSGLEHIRNEEISRRHSDCN